MRMKAGWLALVLTGLATGAACADDALPAPPRVREVPLWPDDSLVLQQGIAALTGEEWAVTAPNLLVYPPRGPSARTAVLVFPGGGFKALAIGPASTIGPGGADVCRWLTEAGITCLLVRYRVPRTACYWNSETRRHEAPAVPMALQDTQRAISLVRTQAEAFGVDPDRIGVLGFSAGGHLAVRASTAFARRAYARIDAIDDASARPDFAIPVYPGHMTREHLNEHGPAAAATLHPAIRVSADVPPTLLVHAKDDDVDPVHYSTVYAHALRQAGADVELRLYDSGGHAFGVRRQGKDSDRWMDDAMRWLGRIGMLRTRPAATALAITGVTVIEPRTGTRLAARTVLVRDGRIVAHGDAAAIAVPAGIRRIDGRGRFLVPGLWDMHVHALWDPVVRTTFLPVLVAHGVTGVRDMGGTLDVLAQVRAEIVARDPAWPRIVAAGPVLDGPQPVDPSVSLAIADADAATAAVARLDAAGVDFIKVYTMLPPAAYRAVVAEAARRGLPVAGHIPYGITAEEAAGDMRSVEHLRAETGGLCAELAPAACDDAWAAMRARGVWQTPTLVARRPRADFADEALVDDPDLVYVPRVLRDVWLANRARAIARETPELHATRSADYARERADAGALPRRGLPVLAGSDAGSDFAVPGAGLHDELELLVAAGLTPVQALQAATSAAADYLGRDDVGTLRAGAVADAVLLDADPLLDIRATRRIHAVMLRGRWLDRAALDAMLDDARRAAE